MEFRFKGKKYDLPVTLNQITVRQKVEFDAKYGDRIKTLRESIFKTDDEGNDLPVDDVDISIFNISLATMNLSHFTGIPLDVVENEMSVDNVMNLYFSCFQQLYDEQDDIELKESYLFNNELWYIQSPILSHESNITFNELITSKQVIKQMQELSMGKWDAIPVLATIYLKKEDEVFNEKWLSPGNERIEMMYDLPMDIAVAVAFFLQSSMSLYLETLVFSQQEVQEMDQTSQHILKNGDGFHS